MIVNRARRYTDLIFIKIKINKKKGSYTKALNVRAW
jgi:hypothetical protein